MFGQNLKQLLLLAPVKGKTFLAIDPAYRTGCKLAVVGPTGKVLATAVSYFTPPQNDRSGGTRLILKLIEAHGVQAVAIGNGTGSRESEDFIANLIREHNLRVSYTIVNEAGASVYSASELAGKELPELDVTLRGAVSIGRRVLDPLAELVKIDPKAIGVGQYQHDVDQKQLADKLTGVVEDCVNSVGVDLNTASPALLRYVAGVTPTVAKNIVAFRDEHGEFVSRDALRKVPRLGPATYTQCAGFLRVPAAKNILDNTPVHPESYALAERFLAMSGDLESLTTGRVQMSETALAQAATELGAGLPTLRDIYQALRKPGRDPREDVAGPVFRSDVLQMEDLAEGMVLTGVVRNVIDFGAFVDIGVKQDGLVHISEISDKYIKHPSEAVAVGDVVKVRILSVDPKRKRIGLSMKGTKR
ncbi:MAG: 30S ribosomal protein S1 [Firmicutes bacterium]|nr:30S ribosomal protein S1 [candidate division NPL-UPA2 bacterium]